MLFNSLEFALIFLPVVLAGFFLLGQLGRVLAACGWLALGSLFFYGYWAPEYLALLLASIGINFYLGEAILSAIAELKKLRAKQLLIIAIALNLLALAYFKYANFFLESLILVTGVSFDFHKVVLPIGISFFTFTQIAYLVDTYQGKVKETNPVHYLLFVTYFPHLIAGPILHHAEMMPQFRHAKTFRVSRDNFLSGTFVFLIGLFKKVVLADGIQPYVGPVFDAPLDQALTPIEAWGGALAYALQLYFDFSAYSDMAIGLSRMFNIELPLNFNSPYKATNIIDFWRRWHMTLSRFLRDYLYVPLGGNRNGKIRRYSNLLTTMLLGGLWHGAGWSFIAWGGLHGGYLVVNHAWQTVNMRLGLHRLAPAFIRGGVSLLLTFFCVVVAWIFFRARDFDAAIRVLHAMFDSSRLLIPEDIWGARLLVEMIPSLQMGPLMAFEGNRQLTWILILLAIVWGMPNTQEVVSQLRRYPWPSFVYAPGAASFMLGVCTFCLCLLLMINETRGISEFIYFNF